MPAKLVRAIILAATLGAAVLAVAEDARACSCAIPGPPLERLAKANAVFRGTVIELDVPWALRAGPEGKIGQARAHFAVWSEASVTVVLEVEESWKGVHTREVALDLGTGLCCDCSIGVPSYEPGDELLVYAYEHDGALHVNICGPPVGIADAGPDLELLGPGERALPPGRTGGDGKPRTSTLIVAAGFGLALALLMLRRGAEPARAEQD